MFGALLTIAACAEKGPLVPGIATRISADGVTGVAGAAVASPPAVQVTASNGTALAGIAVTFAIQGGGGSVTGAAQTTNSEGIATVGSWTLGTTVGANTLTANTSSLPEITFTATGVAGAAAKLAVVTPPSATATNRVAIATQPVVHVQDAHSNIVTTSTAVVTAAVTTGGGAAVGTAAIAAIGGVATFTNLSIEGTAGAKTLTFSSPGIASATAPVTTSAGAAAIVAINAGNNQGSAPSSAVAVAPSVTVTDADANPVAGTIVTFAVASGGGNATGTTPTSNAAGIAAVGSWTLGAATGANTLTATATGLTGSPITFTATATNTLISTITPATLTSGVSATITGTGFSATPANNAVTIDGVAATVTAANTTSLTVTVPTLPCVAAHSGVVSVNVTGLGSTTTNHPVRAATEHALAVGGSVVMSTAAEARCNELSNTGGMYYVSVYNTSPTYNVIGAAFELKGAAGAAAAVANANVVSPLRAPPPPRAFSRAPTAQDRADRAHVALLERDLEFLRQNGRRWRQGATANSVTGVGPRASAVGDPMELRLRNLDVAGCDNYFTINGRVVYVGTKSIIVEDNADSLAGTIDTTYQQIGNEFDTVMWPILETNYGNALANDAVLDNNGRIIMVFSNKVGSLLGGGIAGFVSPCDFFQRTQVPSSNQGEYFYAISPTVAGDIDTPGSPPRWRWTMRGTIIHEVKHIVSSAERYSRNGGTVFEESWLEETTARLSEELYERARYSFAQRSNIGYGSAGNPVGPYCGVRLDCGQPRGIVRVFEDLDFYWYSAPHNYSPIGRIDGNDFSFYATGWSLIRWAIDASATSEANILKGMTQDPTRIGIANFDQHTGTTYAAALPKWTLAMVIDDYPALVPADATLKQPSWNFRDVFAGYDQDFVVPWVQWPLIPLANTFGAFTRSASVRAGTAAMIELSGTQSAKQLLELKASGSSAAAPAELRMAIVRVQ
ncbi:MAG: IPT/TIG domain-containing protein [Gemmatimonadaceae bacterium]